MSRLLVLGATGGTGAALVRQALEAGHEVSAFARDPATIPVPHHERLRALRGDIMDAEQVSRAVAGHDAVLSALGSRGLGPTRVYSEGIVHVLGAMKVTHAAWSLMNVTNASPSLTGSAAGAPPRRRPAAPRRPERSSPSRSPSATTGRSSAPADRANR